MDDKRRPLYMIGITAQIIGMHPQTLRLYERLGLVNPSRSGGKTRLYSDEDIERLKKIQHLTQEMGINLAGVEVILNLLERMETMRGEMETEMTRMHDDMEQQMRQFMREEDDEEDVL